MNNQVMLGTLPCEVGDKGVNGLYLSCDTPNPGNLPEANLVDLPVTI